MSNFNSSTGSAISVLNFNDSENDTDEDSSKHSESTSKEDPLNCGKILFLNRRMHFKCNFCEQELNNVTVFMDHLLKQHLILDQEVIDEIMIDTLTQLSTYVDSITRRRVQLIEEAALLASLEPLAEEHQPQIKFEDLNEEECGQECYEEFEILDEISEDEHCIDNKRDHKEVEFQIELLEKTPITPTKVERSPETEFKPPPQTRKKKLKRKQIDFQNTSFTCDVCQKQFKNKILLNVHMKRHSAHKPYACHYCDAHFTDNSNLKVHINRHLGIKPHACTICSKAFASTTELKLHMRSHTGEKPYVCEECGQRFSNSGHLGAHRRRHYNERPFQCETCGKDFFDRRLLRDHEAAHSSVRPFECNICGTTFTRQKALNEHAKLHSGIRKYACKICDKTFAQNAGLWSHMRQHHTSKTSS